MELFNTYPDKNKKLKITVYFSHNEIDSELDLKDKNVVVIDVLRTSTTMITGLANGAKEIIPTESIAAAGIIGRNSQGQALLCGEKNGKLIEGFNLGNSVKEYSEENVRGKSLIFCSTNGTPSLIKSKFTRNCVVLGFVNISRVVKYINGLGEDIIVLCSGKEEAFSLEDTVCAGMFVSLLTARHASEHKFELSDSAMGAARLYSSYKKDLLKMMHESEHGKYLVSLGFERDLVDCSMVDLHDVLPVQRHGVIKSIEAFESDPKLAMKKVTKSA